MALSRQPAVSACCSLIWSLRSLPASLSWPDVGLDPHVYLGPCSDPSVRFSGYCSDSLVHHRARASPQSNMFNHVPC